MKRVLVTGAAGFIGSHLVEHLLRNTDWKIIILDKLTYASNGFNRLREVGAYENKRVKLYPVDLSRKIGSELEREIGSINYIAHLAAETHVDNSIGDPRPFVEANVLATMEMLEYARRLPGLEKMLYFSTDEVFGPASVGVEYKEWDRYNSANPYSATKAAGEELCLAWANTYKVPTLITHCHDIKTRAFTPDGIKTYNELCVGDKVFALRDEELVETVIREKVRLPYSGKMIRIRSNKVSHLVTPNHRELIQRPVGKPRRIQPVEVVRADSLLNFPNRVYIPVAGKWNCATAVPISFPNPTHFNMKKVDDFSPELMSEFIGWYVSEGSSNGMGTISIAQEKIENLNTISEILDQTGLYYSYSGRAFFISSGILARYLEEQCGQGSENKKLPDFILQYKPYLLKLLLNSMIAGDGTWYGKSAVYYTKSPRLAEQTAELGIKLGYSTAISERYTWNPDKTKKSKSFIVRLRKAVAGIQRKHTKEVDYSGDVWCLRTDEGNFFIERDGIVSCSGNTMNAIGERQHREKFIPKVVKSVLTGDKVTIHGDLKGNSGSRFYIHCRNIAAATLFLLERGQVRDKYNIVGEKEVSNLELAQMIAAILDKPLYYEMVDFHSSRPGHDLRYALDGTKLKEMGWDIPKKFNDSLEKTVRWMIQPENLHWLGL